MLSFDINSKSSRTYQKRKILHSRKVFNNKSHLASEELLQSFAHLIAFFESSQDSIITKDLTGIITSWNPASEKIYGYSSSEAIGKSIIMLFPPELKYEFFTIMNRIKAGQKVEYYDTVRMRKDGKRVHVSLSASPIRDAEGLVIGAAGIGRDITERIELEKHKDDFISIASHELKTPLTTLKGFSQILLHHTNKLEPGIVCFIEKMNQQVDKLNVLVNDLLDVSQINSGKIILKKEQFMIDDLVTEVANDMQLISPDHQIVLDLRAKRRVWADHFRLEQVLANLISNAIKYSPQAKKVVVRSRAKSSVVSVYVEDFGIGIFPKDKERVFDRFFQAKNKIRESFSGLGLGLYICDQIIKRHKGTIGVESVKSRGSTFFFSLPIRQ